MDGEEEVAETLVFDDAYIQQVLQKHWQPETKASI
jgi:hypothetical protein